MILYLANELSDMELMPIRHATKAKLLVWLNNIIKLKGMPARDIERGREQVTGCEWVFPYVG